MAERIGLLAFWKNYDRKLYVRAAKLADELGYDSIWLPEAWGYEVFSLLTEIAIETKRIKIGTGIVNVFSRSPGLLAMSAATLDEISEGRFMLGLGASGARVIEGFHGRSFEKPLTHVKDAIRVVRTLLAGQNLVRARSKLHRYRPFTLEMAPVRSTVPIYVAALKENSIRAIGELADGWMPAFWPHEELGRGHAWIREGAEAAGRDPSGIETAPFMSVIPLGGQAAEQLSKSVIAFYVGGMGDFYRELLESFGFGDECARIAELYRNRDTRAQAADAVTDRMMHALTIVGDPEFCAEELRRRRAFGIGLPILNLPMQGGWPVQEAFLRAMAPSG